MCYKSWKIYSKSKSQCFHTNKLHQGDSFDDNVEMGMCDNFIRSWPGHEHYQVGFLSNIVSDEL